MRGFAHGSWTLIVSNGHLVSPNRGGFVTDVKSEKFVTGTRQRWSNMLAKGLGQKKCEKRYTPIYIKNSINQSSILFYKKWPTPTFRCNSKEKSKSPRRWWAKKVSTAHFRVTQVTSVTRKSGPAPRFLAHPNQLDTDRPFSNAFSLKTFFLPSDFRTALSIPESLSRK